MALGWTCIRHTDDSTIAYPLPGSFYGRKDMFVEYRLRLKIERLKENLSEKTADSVSVLLVPLLRELGSVPVWEAVAENNSSAKCVFDAESGVFSKKHTYVNVRSTLDVRLPEGKVTMHIFYSIDVDDVSQLVGVLDLAVLSVSISLKSKAESTLYGFKGTPSKNTAMLFENTNCNIPIVFPDTAGRPRKSRSLSLNAENRATLEISRLVVVEPVPQYNMGPNMGLDARLCAEEFIEDRDVFDY
ncbi:hypothetical protein V1515DRAFT_580097 [Lipomyces mesembrius]